jgi:hypothetical protein
MINRSRRTRRGRKETELVVVRAAGEVPEAEGEVEGSEGEEGGVVASKVGLDGSLE